MAQIRKLVVATMEQPVLLSHITVMRGPLLIYKNEGFYYLFKNKMYNFF